MNHAENQSSDRGSSQDTLTVDWPVAKGGATSVPATIGDVRVEREIGRGGMGIVFRGWDEVLARPVAVKFLLGIVAEKDSADFARFVEGARAAAAVRHAALNVVYQADVKDGVPFLVMDYIDGPSLHALVKRCGPLTATDALAVLAPVAEAISALHDHDVVHRDIKPANILIDTDGGVFVTDFGLAVKRSASTVASVSGTPSFMAPETFDGTVSPRSDVYALGITAYAILTGEHPFKGSPASIRDRHSNDALPIESLELHGVDGKVREVLERATHKNPTFRHKTAGHFLRAMRDAVGEIADGPEALSSLVARSRAKPGEAEKHPSEPSDGSSYADKLATLADVKRRRRPRPVAPPAAAASPRAGTLQVDLPCISCQYNLRGLSAETNCPECGVPLSSSLDRDRLVLADKRWLSKVVFGQRLFLGAVAVSALLGFFGGIVIAAIQLIRSTQGVVPMGFYMEIFFDGVALVFMGIVTAGIVLVTSREPTHVPTMLARVNRLGTRAASLLAALLLIMAATNLSSGAWDKAPFVLAAGWVGCLAYILTLASRIGDDQLVRWSVRWIVVLPVLIAWAAAQVFWSDVIVMWIAVSGLLLSFANYSAFKRVLAAHIPYDTLFADGDPLTATQETNRAVDDSGRPETDSIDARAARQSHGRRR